MKFKVIIPIIVSFVIILGVVGAYNQPNNEPVNIDNNPKIQQNIIEENSLFLIHKNQEDIVGKNEEVTNYSRYILSAKKENQQIYESLGPKNSTQTTVVIIPVFTALAYHNPGFYDYYTGRCNEECLTVDAASAFPLKFDYRTSAMANQVFQILGYDRISDEVVLRNPSILSEYDRVILLHNEYVTKEMFEAITNHPKVIYLYPNALYAEIEVDLTNSSITLIRGHGYPEKNISNGFEWEFDNTIYEQDKDCTNWEFYKIDNGFMLNCYPELIIFDDMEFLKTIRDL